MVVGGVGEGVEVEKREVRRRLDANWLSYECFGYQDEYDALLLPDTKL